MPGTEVLCPSLGPRELRGRDGGPESLSMSLDSLYQEIILDHYRKPRNFGDLPEASISMEHENPVCGDHLALHVQLRDGAVEDIKFQGKGCAISMSSASMMTESVKGRSVEETRSTIESFLSMLRGESPDEQVLGDLVALQGVSQFPVRVKCAALAWTALRQCLRQTEG